MRYILARRNLATLTDFACSSVLLGFDYDGTLVPIASNPARARVCVRLPADFSPAWLGGIHAS